MIYLFLLLHFFSNISFANIVRPFVQIYSCLVVGEGGGCVFFIIWVVFADVCANMVMFSVQIYSCLVVDDGGGGYNLSFFLQFLQTFPLPISSGLCANILLPGCRWGRGWVWPQLSLPPTAPTGPTVGFQSSHLSFVFSAAGNKNTNTNTNALRAPSIFCISFRGIYKQWREKLKQELIISKEFWCKKVFT